MADPAFDSTGTAPDLGDVVNDVTGPAPQPAAPSPPQPATPPAPQPPAPQPTQPVAAPPQAPEPGRPYAYGEEPWRQPAAPPTPQPAATPQTPDFLSYVAEKGLDMSQFGENADPTKVADYLMEQASAAQQYRRQLQHLQQQPPAQPEPPPEPTPEPPKPTGVEPPALTDADRWVMKGLQNGTVKEEDLLPQQRANIESWMDWRAKRAEALVDRPMEVLRDDVEKYLAEQGFVRKDQLDSLMQEAKEKQFIAEVNHMYEPHFYDMGEDGKPKVDPTTSQPRLSEWGWKFVEARDYFSKTCGITDPVRLTQAVIRAIGEPVSPEANGNGEPPQPTPPAPPAATPQQAFTEAATQAATAYPPYPPADRGGVQGQPLMETVPDDMTPPDLNAVAQEILGPAAHGWR